jgi:putative PIN family toxin of toxin-antitoxin system
VIRTVLDANVLVAGFPSHSNPSSRILDLWLENQIELVISKHIFDEVARAWNKPYWSSRFSPDEAAQALNALWAEIVPVFVEVKGIATHWHDDIVIATALSGKADYLITRDKDLRAVGEYSGVKIRTPQEFLEEFATLS